MRARKVAAEDETRRKRETRGQVFIRISNTSISERDCAKHMALLNWLVRPAGLVEGW